MNEKFWSLAHEPVHHTCITLSYIAREGEIEKTDPYGMERKKGMGPNKVKVNDTMLDKHLDDPSGATNRLS